MERKTHHIVKTAVDSRYGGGADPFLYSVGSGFIERLESFYVQSNLVVGKWAEAHMSGF